jgi:lysosomal acid lipase/cholesteryl ester hydrolase
VWLGNSRGSDHSLQHKNLTSKSKEYWDFSWHEIGFYDVPAMIDCMLNETKTLRTFYVGHSQGTTSLLVMLSMRPEYNRKIIQAHLMAPAAFMKNLPNPLAKLFINEIEVQSQKRCQNCMTFK